MLMFVTVEAEPTLMLPPKAIVGPPIRTKVPEFIVIETHTSVDAAPQPTVPPCVKLAVPTRVPLTVRSTVDAEAAGTMARAAIMTRTRIGSFRLAYCTISHLSKSNLGNYVTGNVLLFAPPCTLSSTLL